VNPVIHLDAATTLESIEVQIGVDADPTGVAPQFALTAVGGAAPTTGWANGTWVTPWVGQNQATCRTPTIGATGSLVVAANTRYWLWWRMTLSGESPVKRVAELVVR